MRALALCALLPLLDLPATVEAPARVPQAEDQDADDPRARLLEGLAAGGVQANLEGGWCALETSVCVLDERLEYLLVGAGGSNHESLLLTEVRGSVLNTALIALGAEAGEDARWIERDPPTTEEERRAGVPTHDVLPPEGGSFFPYLAWREGEETFFFRAEDLLQNLARGRRMLRHSWAYLGSRFLRREGAEREVFVADEEENLINIAWFGDGNTLISATRADCVDQTIWAANAWMLPDRGSPLLLILAREPLVELPASLVPRLPLTAPPGAAAEAEAAAARDG